jgi:methyl-accepting chemotaxis protein
MRQSAQAAISALQSITRQVNELESASASIASAVDQQSLSSRDLSKNIDFAARHANEVSFNIGEVHDASIATGGAASQLLAASTDLERLAGVMADQAREFLDQVRVG